MIARRSASGKHPGENCFDAARRPLGALSRGCRCRQDLCDPRHSPEAAERAVQVLDAREDAEGPERRIHDAYQARGAHLKITRPEGPRPEPTPASRPHALHWPRVGRLTGEGEGQSRGVPSGHKRAIADAQRTVADEPTSTHLAAVWHTPQAVAAIPPLYTSWGGRKMNLYSRRAPVRDHGIDVLERIRHRRISGGSNDAA